MAGNAIPNYELYGDRLSGTYSDAVHYETIQERSSRHDWTIRLHRHNRLTQLFLFRSSGVAIRLRDEQHFSTEPMLLLVPPGVPHGFRFDKDINGDVLSLKADALEDGTAALLDRPGLKGGGLLAQSRAPRFDFTDRLMAEVAATYHGISPERDEMLEALIRLILTGLAGDLQRQGAAEGIGRPLRPGRHEEQAERFCTLIEARFREALTVGDYADEIGVSAPHLNRVCRAVLGAGPNELVRRRRLLEAKRLLEYTRYSVSEVALRSGYRDPAFFSRSFRKATGQSPADFRRSHEAG